MNENTLDLSNEAEYALYCFKMDMDCKYDKTKICVKCKSLQLCLEESKRRYGKNTFSEIKVG